MTAGMLFARTNPQGPLDVPTYNKWYNTTHMREVCDSGLCDLAMRYKNLDPAAEFQFQAIYRIPDVADLQQERLKEIKAGIPKISDLLPSKEEGSTGGNCLDLMDVHSMCYECLQTFENPSAEGKRSDGIVTVLLEPEEGSEDDFEKWCRRQHFDMEDMDLRHERSTQYKKLDGEAPRYMAIHEYATADITEQQMESVTGTERSEKVMKGVKTYDRNVWKYASEHRTEISEMF